jgi:hypothetical protein
VNLKVPIQSLLNLPDDAAFTGKNGRANVAVKVQGDTIVVEAKCDSLQALCEYYERELTRIRGDTSDYKSEVEEEVTTGIQSPFKWFSIGFVAGVIITIIFIIYIKK